jgi:hypothetical protein
MSLAITLNLIFIAIVVGGWSAAVWAFYKHLGDPHEEQSDPRSAAAEQLDTSYQPERVLVSSHGR